MKPTRLGGGETGSASLSRGGGCCGCATRTPGAASAPGGGGPRTGPGPPRGAEAGRGDKPARWAIGRGGVGVCCLPPGFIFFIYFGGWGVLKGCWDFSAVLRGGEGGGGGKRRGAKREARGARVFPPRLWLLNGRGAIAPSERGRPPTPGCLMPGPGVPGCAGSPPPLGFVCSKSRFHGGLLFWFLLLFIFYFPGRDFPSPIPGRPWPPSPPPPEPSLGHFCALWGRDPPCYFWQPSCGVGSGAAPGLLPPSPAVARRYCQRLDGGGGWGGGGVLQNARGWRGCVGGWRLPSS